MPSIDSIEQAGERVGEQRPVYPWRKERLRLFASCPAIQNFMVLRKMLVALFVEQSRERTVTLFLHLLFRHETQCC